MKLADFKKLKVTELRSRLKELGLDSRGLKAELVERLWSASDAGLISQTPPEPEPTETAGLLSPPAEPADAPRSETDSVKELRDSATQTDAGPGSPAAPRRTSAAGEGGEPGKEPRPAEIRGRAFYEFKEEIRYKRAKSPLPSVDIEEEEHGEDEVRIDPHCCHLHFEAGPDGSSGQPRFWARFPLLWSGCRLTHGVQQGRASFEVRLERKLLTAQQEAEEVGELCGLRVGWSAADASLLLGKDELSFSYDGCGQKVSAGRGEQFGESFSEGDIIGCFASFSIDGAVELSFHKNGSSMGVAFSLAPSVLQGRPLFPHVLCKSCSVRFHLDPSASPWYPGPPGFTPLVALPAGQRVRSRPAPTSRSNCEVVLMVGLPGSGKSFWAKTHMKQHPEKQFRLLGTEELLACMIRGGWRDSMLQQASQCLTALIKVAAETPGNYILDQCNVHFSARHHKLQLFAGFRRVVVVVFPSAPEWRRRLSQRQLSDGEAIPATSLLKLQVSCSLPEHQADLLEELQYVEQQQDRAQTTLQELKDEARRLLPHVHKEEKKPRLHKKRPHPHGAPVLRRNQWTGLPVWNSSRANIQPRYDQSCYYSKGFSYSGCENHWC
ncbi:heterogeneous nuclear ribonucleoprotein U-like protein 2 [Salarias fasciatus]|uniref:heterogeneous nuclear ribonucleoprotein U-like protein 2 n=1 Tax=Salarias fasciatus TaxID=181472 RepID=UPI001176F29E|nr:heterogeneous nuclear ribonucleoprotein U-like protein 2 [Salarias fasciatus]